MSQDKRQHDDEAFLKERGFGMRIGFGERPAPIVIDMLKALTNPDMMPGADLDARAVYRAMATRVDPAKDIFVVPATRGSLSEPSGELIPALARTPDSHGAIDRRGDRSAPCHLLRQEGGDLGEDYQEHHRDLQQDEERDRRAGDL